MQFAQPEVLQGPVGQVLGQFLHCRTGPSNEGDVGVRLGSVDARADHEHLPAGGDLLTHPLPCSIQPRGVGCDIDHGGLHRLSSGWDLAQGRHLQVAEDRHRDRPRYGGGGEHEQVGNQSGPGLQDRALFDAETVLFVDDHQPEVGEPHLIGQQCVRADHDACLAIGDLREDVAALSSGHGAGEQHDLGGLVRRAQHLSGTQLAEHHPQRVGVLGGQYLSRCQQGCLASGVDLGQHGPAAPPPSCPTQPRPAAAAASDASGPCPGRSGRSPRAGHA